MADLDKERERVSPLEYTIKATELEYAEICRVVLGADVHGGGVSLNTRRAVAEATYARRPAKLPTGWGE